MALNSLLLKDKTAGRNIVDRSDCLRDHRTSTRVNWRDLKRFRIGWFNFRFKDMQWVSLWWLWWQNRLRHASTDFEMLLAMPPMRVLLHPSVGGPNGNKEVCLVCGACLLRLIRGLAISYLQSSSSPLPQSQPDWWRWPTLMGAIISDRERLMSERNM
jgi:hypothetical protein